MSGSSLLPEAERPSYPFTVRDRDIWAIALPASLAFITEPMVGIVDITVIGRLGEAALIGGLALGALTFDFIFALARFLRMGTAGLTAQAVGAKDPADGLMHAVRALLLAVAIGFGLIALGSPILMLAKVSLAPSADVAPAFATYFGVRIWSAPFALVNYVMLGWFYGRAAARTGMSLQILLHGVHTGLSILFVFGFGWSVAGAAAGSVIGEAAASAAGLVLFVRHFGGIVPMWRMIAPAQLRDAAALRRMVALSRDLVIRSAALMTAYGVFAAIGSRTGEIVLSGNALLLNIMMVSSFFLDGLAQASEQLCGKAVGANWQPAFETATRRALGTGLAFSAVLATLLYFGGAPLIELMTTSEPVRAEAKSFLWLAALTSFTGMPAFVYDGILTGATLNVDMRNGMLASLLVFVVVAVLAVPLLDNYGLWLALHAWLLARGGIFWWAVGRRKSDLFVAQA